MRRRTFLLAGLGAAGALVVGWGAMPPRQRLVPDAPLPEVDGKVTLNGWVRIGRDDTVGIIVPKSEMGQGVHTAAAMLLAEELDADWSRVRIEPATIDRIYNNLATVVDGLPFHPDDTGIAHRFAGWMVAKTMREIGLMVTGGSSSVKDLWEPMRMAGAAARAMLLQAAAETWRVPASTCRVENGVVVHAGGARARFGELAGALAAVPAPAHVTLKAPDRYTIIGQPLPRIEAAEKAQGRARFGIDVRPPGLLHAAITMCPTLGGSVRAFDATRAERLPGVRKVVRVSPHHGGTGGVAVIAEHGFIARRALEQLSVDWDPGPAAGFSSAAAIERLRAALDESSGFAYRKVGDVDAALAGAARRIEAEYTAPYLAHAAMEPLNCTVQFRDGRATVWASTQVPGQARRAVAKALGIGEDRVDVHVMLLGGGFGRRLDIDFVGQAAEVARAADGAPVQLLWSREQDTTHDLYRPACVARLAAGVDAGGALVAWRSVSASQAIVPQVMRRQFGLPGAGPDKTTAEGAFDQPYELAAARIAHVTVELPVQVGFWRSVGHSHQAFFKESFVDEIAVATGRDPLELRRSLLAQHPRARAVLDLAARAAGWGTPLAPAPDGARVARGLALHRSFGSIVAQVAEVSIGADGAIRVHRVVCAIDCGIAVNPNLVAQQMESGVVFGLTAALHGEITIERGQVAQTNFHDYPALRIHETPVVETHIVPSAAPPEGVGEPGTPPIAPAVANAIHALTGQRLRSLPLRLAKPRA